MNEIIIDALLDGLKDTALSLPILFVAYLFMEMLEESKKLNETILYGYSHKAGPALGGILGIIPQCGISGAAATLYSTGTITLGTMLAVFFATSDEMLPILLSSLSGAASIGVKGIVLILIAKSVAGIVLGYITDIAVHIGSSKDIHSFCEREHCGCDDEEEDSEDGEHHHSHGHAHVVSAALRHTVKIAIMLFIVNVALTLVIGLVGVERLSGTVINAPIIGEILAGLFGLIPNCSVSVVLTQSYVDGVLGIGSLFSGLLSNAGIGLLVLFRNNKNLKENFIITGVLFGLSVIAGIVVSALAGLFI